MKKGGVWTVRNKRAVIYRKSRLRKIKRFILLVIVLPVLGILVGYLISSLFILPSIAKR